MGRECTGLVRAVRDCWCTLVAIYDFEAQY